MNPIQSFDEAFKVAARISEDSKRLSDFMKATQTTFEPFKKMFGMQGSVAVHSKDIDASHSEAPDSIVGRVMAILETADFYLTPKMIADEYRKRGYPEPAGGVAGAMSGTLSYLYGRKQTVLRDEHGGYYLPHRKEHLM